VFFFFFGCQLLSLFWHVTPDNERNKQPLIGSWVKKEQRQKKKRGNIEQDALSARDDRHMLFNAC